MSSRLKTLALVALLAASPGTLPAQPEGPYDLAAVVRTALRNHPSLRASGAQVEAARAQLQGARSAALPKLSASLAYTQLEKDPYFVIDSLGRVVFGETQNKQASLVARMPLYTGGRLEGAARQARSALEASESGLERQRQRVALEATRAYHDVLRARGLVSVAQDQLQSLQAQRDAIQKRVEAGVSTRIDLLRAETALSAAQEGLTRARNAESVALAALAAAMGLQASPDLQVLTPEDEPASPDDLPADPRAAAEEALRSRPEMRQVEASRRAALSGVRVARSGYRPTIGAFAQADAERPTFAPKTGVWSAGVTLTMSVFDSGATRAEVRRARAQVEEVEAARDNLRNAITVEATQALLSLQSARERVTTARRSVETAEEGLRLVRRGYENGVNTITDLLAAQAEHTQARSDLVAALSDLRDADAELRYALGREVLAP